MIPAVADVVLVVFASTAAWWDATTHRIPNKITVTGFAVALLLRAPLGLDVLLQGLAGAGIALLPAVVFYALGAIGGGDVKLLAAVGAFLGSPHIVGALALAAVLGAAFALGSHDPQRPAGPAALQHVGSGEIACQSGASRPEA